jgi:hypothetical protein
VDTLAGDRPLRLRRFTRLPFYPPLLDSFSAKLGHAGDGLRTNCETTVPSVKRDIKEMIPSEITQ